MKDLPDKPDHDLSLVQLLPNLITITAIAAGLTAIRFGLQGRFELSAQLILLAAILDGVDGRLARALKCDSKIGAELDSLADFLNFGVAPPLVIYFWALQDMRSEGWLAVLVFSISCVLRLARFNVSNKTETKGGSSYFVGVPAPAGALLVMLPMYISFSVSGAPVIPETAIATYMVVVGLLLISPIPTPSLKGFRVPRGKARFVILALVFVGAAVMTFPWITLAVLCTAYVAAVLFSLFRLRGRKARIRAEE